MREARAIMHIGMTCIGEHDTLATAAKRMRELGVGALPILGDDNRLHGVVTDRDIVVECIATGKDPAVLTAGDLAQGHTYHVDADASVEDALAIMAEHQVRRLPVLDDHRPVGIISESDIARHLPKNVVGEFVAAICCPRVALGH